MIAIIEACYLIYTHLDTDPYLPRTVIIYSDSQAALQSLFADNISSRTVQQAVNSLNALGRSVNIILRYVKAHSGIEGNELADSLAKDASSKLVPYTKPLVYISKAVVKSLVQIRLLNLWSNRWNESKTGPVSYTHLTLPTKA